MPWDATSYGAAAPVLLELGTSTLTATRLFVWSGAPPVAALAGSGADVDGVTLPQAIVSHDGGGNPVYANPSEGYLAQPGLPVKVEAGAAFAAGTALQSDASGRAVARTTGIGVLRALEAAAGAGSVVWAVFTSGR